MPAPTTPLTALELLLLGLPTSTTPAVMRLLANSLDQRLDNRQQHLQTEASAQAVAAPPRTGS